MLLAELPLVGTRRSEAPFGFGHQVVAEAEDLPARHRQNQPSDGHEIAMSVAALRRPVQRARELVDTDPGRAAALAMQALPQLDVFEAAGDDASERRFTPAWASPTAPPPSPPSPPREG